MTHPPCLRLCPAYPGNPRYRIEGESPLQGKGHTVYFSSYFVSSGYCRAANRKVSGTTPKTLKFTQTSVDCVRQTISLRIASAKKNSAQRRVSRRQPSSVR